MPYARVLTGLPRAVAVVVCSLLITACSNGSDIASSSDPGTSSDPGPTQTPPEESPPEESPPEETPPDEDAPLSANFSVDQNEVDRGGSVQLRWSSTGALRCEADGAWAGSIDRSGNRQVGPLDRTSTFTLRCSGRDGEEVVEMISVSVLGTFVVNWQAPQENVDGTPLTDLAEFRLFYGTDSRDYTESVTISGASATTRTIKAPLGDYFVAMKSVNADGVESEFSNEVVMTSS